ncbi:hypothetical protein J4214_05930 [Candidatus Woesearchaeota archaeon]|nr:hypothetical protein [Candidatus Woesearchaeota archaeon]
MHFQDLDIRIGKINGVKEHPNADRLYIISVEVGSISRDIEIISGIRDHYIKDELLGKKIVVLINLEPATLRGIESNGMLLAAVYTDNVVLLTTNKSVPGNRVYIKGMERKKPKKRIGIEDWKKIKLVTLNNKVKFEDYFLRTDKEEIFTDKEVPDGCNIR